MSYIAITPSESTADKLELAVLVHDIGLEIPQSDVARWVVPGQVIETDNAKTYIDAAIARFANQRGLKHRITLITRSAGWSIYSCEILAQSEFWYWSFGYVITDSVSIATSANDPKATTP